ncbi:MAG TPA: hypothetical protein VK937_16395 [Candidatus Limnocylindria bacterium]|nr:hypothetical protein [Candidatus Limnocylindria bacterium]
MSRIEVKISPTVTQEQRQDPRFIKLLQEVTYFFNSPNHFTKKYRGLLCLHEAGHIVYARRTGVTEIGFHGPTLYWCSGCPGCSGNTPSISRSSVTWNLPSDCGVTAALKAYVGGIIFRAILSDKPNDEVAAWSDMTAARRWYQEHVELDENAFLCSIETARQEIIEDLKSVEFREFGIGYREGI